MQSDASHMLEAALEQMDDIIAGKFPFLLRPPQRQPGLQLLLTLDWYLTMS
jgi:hypothetical protein